MNQVQILVEIVFETGPIVYNGLREPAPTSYIIGVMVSES